MYSKAIDMTLKHIQKSNEFDYNNLERLDFGLLLEDKKLFIRINLKTMNCQMS